MKIVLAILRAPVRLLNWFWWYFGTKEIGYLALIMAVVLFLGALNAGRHVCTCTGGCICLCPLSRGGVWIESFVSLFSAEKASQNWVTMLLFLVTWLVGGGALVSVMVGRFYKKVAGELRWWPWLVDDHIVVLGWDDGVLMELVNELKSKNPPSKCYVITSRPVKEVERFFGSATIAKSRICVYHGNYDDEREWKTNLRVKNARRVFIMGEHEEDAHDARVRMLYDKINTVLQTSKKKPIINVSVRDFGLAQRLDPKGHGLHKNFHLTWSLWLWKEWRLDLNENEKFELFICGFGAMGKAVAMKAIEKNKNISVVFVSDDDDKKLKEESGRFIRQFADVKRTRILKGYTTTYYKNKSIIFVDKWDEALTRLTRLKHVSTANGRGCRKVVVVAKKRSEKGMLCMMDIVKQLRDANVSNVALALDQEVDGYSVAPNDKVLRDVEIDGFKVQLFGMKRGCKWL